MTNVCLNKKVDVFVMPRTVCLTDGLTNLNWTQKLKKTKKWSIVWKCLIKLTFIYKTYFAWITASLNSNHFKQIHLPKYFRGKFTVWSRNTPHSLPLLIQSIFQRKKDQSTKAELIILCCSIMQEKRERKKIIFGSNFFFCFLYSRSRTKKSA
jgi:hypothetical protein